MADTLTSASLLDFHTLASSMSGDRTPDDKWHASGVQAVCPLAATLLRLGVAPRKEMTDEDRRLMEAGTRGHANTRESFRELGVLHLPPDPCGCGKPMSAHNDDSEFHLFSETRNVTTSLDLLIGGEVQEPDGNPRIRFIRENLVETYGGLIPPTAIEVKTVSPSAIKYILKGDINQSWMRQVGIMQLCVRENPELLPFVPEKWELLVVSRDKGFDGRIPPPVSVEVSPWWADKMGQHLDILNNAWETRVLPECWCVDPWSRRKEFGRNGPTGNWLVGFCSFSTGEVDCCESAAQEVEL